MSSIIEFLEILEGNYYKEPCPLCGGKWYLNSKYDFYECLNKNCAHSITKEKSPVPIKE